MEKIYSFTGKETSVPKLTSSVDSFHRFEIFGFITISIRIQVTIATVQI